MFSWWQAVANGKERTADPGLDPPRTTSNGMMKMLTMINTFILTGWGESKSDSE